MSAIVLIIIIAVLVLVHEFGHFIVAKKNNVEVTEFGIGFPPRVAKLFHYKGTDYTLNLIPFGGFVKMPEELTGFTSISKWSQAFILSAGIIFNIVFAWLLFSIAFMVGLGDMQLSFFGSILKGGELVIVLIKEISLAFATIISGIFTGGVEGSVVGPVGLVSFAGDALGLGISQLLYFTGLISVNLAIINLIPFPALDGGRLLFLLIESIKGSKIKQSVANNINFVGFVILIVLMVLVTVGDVKNLII